MSLCGGLVFFAPVALLVRTQAGISETQFFLLQALLSGIIALGELPTGHLTDRMGYRRSLILAQLLLLAARGLLLAAFLLRSLPLFVAEAVVEGISACLSSGTASVYLYALYGESDYLPKAAHAANFGTAGFLLSTAAYALLYRYFGLTGLLAATVLAGATGDRVPLCLLPAGRPGDRLVLCPVRRAAAPGCAGVHAEQPENHRISLHNDQRPVPANTRRYGPSAFKPHISNRKMLHFFGTDGIKEGELWQRRRRYVTRFGTQCIPARRHGADPAVAAAKGRYVRLPAGAGDGTAQRRTAENPGGLPVPGAVPAAGAGTDLRPPGAGGQANDPRILPPGARRRSPAGGNDPGI